MSGFIPTLPKYTIYLVVHAMYTYIAIVRYFGLTVCLIILGLVNNVERFPHLLL